MKPNKIILMIILASSLLGANAQQDAQKSMYMFNMLPYNPAYAGSKECMYAVATYRSQWVGIEGAPQTLNLNFHSPLLNQSQYAFGGSARGDKAGNTMRGNVDGYFAYRLKLMKDTKLSLGVSVGFMYYQLNIKNSKVDDKTDILLNNTPNKLLPNFGFGAYLYNPKYYIGLSVPHILSPSLREITSGVVDTFLSKQVQHFYASGGLILGKGDVMFRPSFMMRYIPEIPFSVDANLSLLLKERIWVGATYRFGGDIYDLNTQAFKFGSGNAIVGILKFLVTPQFEVGYSYDYPLSSLNSVTSATHEVILGYNFCKNKKLRYVTPRYISYF